MGLAWTPLGGTTLYVEAMTAPGSNNTEIKLTGQLGEVMVESCHIACSFIIGNASMFGVDKDFFKGKTGSPARPGGATKKTALRPASPWPRLLSPWRWEETAGALAMTGELTLTGRVLPVGGIKEKIIAAKRSKVAHVILPKIT